MNRRGIGCMTLLILWKGVAFGQFSDTTHYYLNLTSTGSVNRTNNSKAYLLNHVLKFTVKKKAYSLNAFSNYIYGKQDSSVSNNDFTTTLDGNLYLRNSKFFFWGLLNYTSSYSLKVNSLFQGGAGAAYSFIDDKNNYLNVSDGLLYETGNLMLDTVHNVYNTYRNSFRVVFKWTIRNILVLNGSNFVQNSLSSRKDYILRSNLGLSVKLKKWLSLTTAFTYNKFSRTGRENLLFNYGLTIEKYF